MARAAGMADAPPGAVIVVITGATAATAREVEMLGGRAGARAVAR